METVAVENSWLATDDAISVLWNMGRRCNFNCSYCNIFTHDNFSPHLSLEVCKKTIDTLIEKTDKKIFMSLTGGEPTVNPDFMEIIKYMHERIDHINVTTNGSRKIDFYLETMKYLNSMTFSYHMEYHAREKIVDTIIACAKEKNNVKCHQIGIHIMMLPTMFDEAKEVMSTLREHDVKIVMRRIRPAFEVDNPINEYEDGRLIKGKIAGPFYGDRTGKTSILLFHKGQPQLGPDYSKGKDYYSEEELVFLKENEL